jgi:hypothetical protein
VECLPEVIDENTVMMTMITMMTEINIALKVDCHGGAVAVIATKSWMQKCGRRSNDRHQLVLDGRHQGHQV